jgi:hypothetical protein
MIIALAEVGAVVIAISFNIHAKSKLEVVV